MYKGLARSSSELKDALQLAARVFRPDEQIEHSVSYKTLIMSAGRDLSCDDVVILAVDEKVIGVCFLIEKQMFRSSALINCVFLASICVAESHRGQGLSTELINAALSICTERKLQLAFVVARRSVDHFYRKFGFIGVSQYSTAQIDLVEAAVKNNINIHPAEEKNISDINVAYRNTYQSLYGAFERTPQFWLSLLKQCETIGMQFSVCKNNGRVIGYIASIENRILELACCDGAMWADIAAVLFARNSNQPLQVSCSPSHPLIHALPEADITINRRQCLYGGHMVKILSNDDIQSVLLEELNQRLDKTGCLTGCQIPGVLSITHEGDKFHISFDNNLSEWKRTYILMAAESLSDDFSHEPWLDLKSFNIPYLDQV